MLALAFSGATCLGLAFADQQHLAQPRLSASSVLPVAPALSSAPAFTRPATGATSKPASPPVALAIPAIGVHSSLLHLGLAADGSLEVPAPGPHFNEAAWYRYSPAPGSLGPSVIVGHVDSAAGGPSVFFRLGSLRPRDTVLVTRADGTVAVFVVDAVRRFHKLGFPSQRVYGDTTGAALRLITCGGPFDGQHGHYLDNIVVFATLRND